MLTAKTYRKNIFRLIDAPRGYEWGKENEEGADCSGTVCFPLIKAGYAIRTTADALYRKLFTITVGQQDRKNLRYIMAVFYVSTVPWTKLSGKKMPIGTCRHVTPVVGRNAVCQASWAEDAIFISDAAEVELEYKMKACNAIWRRIDTDMLVHLSKTREEFYGVDKEVGHYVRR